MIKALQKNVIQETYLNIIKPYVINPHLPFHLIHVKNWKHFLKIKNKTRMSTLSTFIQNNFGSPSSHQRRNKKNLNWKSKTVTTCRWRHTIHKNPKDATREILESSVNSVMWQDTKLIWGNLLHFYILTTKE